MTATMILCQISDLHITAQRRPAYGVVDTATMLERCVKQIMSLDPPVDAVLASGDLVDGGSQPEYEVLRDLLAPLRAPVYLLPGNHDDRDALRAAFADHAYLHQHPRFCQYVIDVLPVRLIVLDTIIKGEAGGALCAERLEWLERTLAASRKPTVIALHHPPFASGVGFMDDIALAEPEKLAAVISKHPNVERVVCGHVHRPIQVRFAGTIASSCPSTAHQVILDLRPGAPSAFLMEPPSFQLHVWDGARLITHTAPIGDFAGPYSFH